MSASDKKQIERLTIEVRALHKKVADLHHLNVRLYSASLELRKQLAHYEGVELAP